MSVLIKGIHMPKDCPMCPLAHWTIATDEFTGCDIVGGKKYARLKDEEYAKSSTRPVWCPLVELPEKHGDLIDRDSLKKDYRMGNDCNDCETDWKSCQYDIVYSKMDFCGWLDDAPVVIEAEDK